MSQEKKYRKLYDEIRLLDPENIDFSMDTSKFDDDEKVGWGAATLSKTLIPFHGTLIGAIVVVMAIQM